MNSQERHLARYKRRKGERLQKQIKDSEIYSYDYAISPIAIKNAYEECRSGTSWKSSVQQYGANEWRNAIEYSKRIKENKYNPKKTKCFIINERGKLRHIAAVDIADRVIQKSLCENVLCPIISKTLIYDNGASQDNKGTSFTSNRLVYHLHKFYNENNDNNNNGWVIIGDGHDYFNSLRHDIIENILNNIFYDKRVVKLAMKYVNQPNMLNKNNPNIGVGLGAQVNQIISVCYASSIDHYVKEVLHCKYYNHFADDWYILIKNKEDAYKILSKIEAKYKELGIQLNPKKTKIRKISKGIVWLKDTYFLTSKGKVVRKSPKDKTVQQRKVIKHLFTELDNNNIEYSQIVSNYNSWLGYVEHKDSDHIRDAMNRLYNKLLKESLHICSYY